MIVTCERCATQFQLDDARVPKQGVKVRCSRCKASFRVVPEAQRAAEAMASLARRAREDSQEEITQDMAAEAAPGDSLSRSRARSERSGGEAARSSAPPAQAGSSGSGLDAEESDWKFNEDVSGELGEAGGAARADAKPEPPLARRGAQNADDWFSGGGDAPLELDDRPWNASDEPEESVAPSEPPATPPRTEAPAPEAVAQAHAAVAEEPSEPADAPTPLAPAAETTSTDELDTESWDLLAGAEDAEKEAEKDAEKDAEKEAPSAASSEATPQEVSAEAKPPLAERRARPLAVGASYLVRGLGYGAHALGWIATAVLFGAALHAGLAPVSPALSGPERVGTLELAKLDGRFVENAVSGALFVVSGRVRNPGHEAGELATLEVELLDAAGEPVPAERAPLHAPFAAERLRELPVSDLSGQPRLAGPIAPGEEAAFEAVIPALPDSAASFRIVESR